MKKALKSVLFVAFLISVPLLATAETPEKAVEGAIAAVKASGKPATILDYVHWETAFANLPAEQKALMKVNSPADLKAFYNRAMTQPDVLIDEQLNKMTANIPEAQKAVLIAQLGTMKATMREKIKETETKVLNAKYEVKSAKVDGSKAVVKLQSTNAGAQPEQHDVDLVNVDGKWMLAGVAAMGN